VRIVESTNQAQRLPTDLCLHDINVTMMLKKWKGSGDSGPKYRVSGDDFRIGADCRKVPMDQCANCGTTVPTVCNLTVTNHEKSEKHQ